MQYANLIRLSGHIKTGIAVIMEHLTARKVFDYLQQD